MKIDRQMVFDKYKGYCAYCSMPLKMRWHIDHIDPKYRGRDDMGGTDNIENLNPACPRCNRWKKTFTVEAFRREIEQQVQRLRKKSAGYRLAEDFRLVDENKIEVEFYFEYLKRMERRWSDEKIQSDTDNKR